MTEADIKILAAALAEQMAAPARWMKLKQAVMYSAIGQQELVRLAKEGKITGFQDSSLKTKPWIIDRDSIDAYRLKQAAVYQNCITEKEQFAIDLVNSLDI